MDKQGNPDQDQIKKKKRKTTQKVEAGMGFPEGIRRHCFSVLEWCQESQSSASVQVNDGCEGQHDGLL